MTVNDIKAMGGVFDGDNVERMETWAEWAAFGLDEGMDCSEQFTTEVDPILGDYESLWGEG